MSCQAPAQHAVLCHMCGRPFGAPVLREGASTPVYECSHCDRPCKNRACGVCKR